MTYQTEYTDLEVDFVINSVNCGHVMVDVTLEEDCVAGVSDFFFIRTIHIHGIKDGEETRTSLKFGDKDCQQLFELIAGQIYADERIQERFWNDYREAA